MRNAIIDFICKFLFKFDAKITLKFLEDRKWTNINAIIHRVSVFLLYVHMYLCMCVYVCMYVCMYVCACMYE